MVDVPTVRLRDVIRDLPSGGIAGLVDQNLTIRNDVVTTAQALPTGGLTGQSLAKVSDSDFDVDWVSAGAGDMLQSMYDPTMIQANAFARANHTGTQPATTITGLATVATSGAYADLSGTPAPITFLAPRVSNIATTASLAPNAGTTDIAAVTALSQALAVAAPTGVPVDGQSLIIRIRDNGVARALTWNAAYSAYAGDLPATTVASTFMLYHFLYSAATAKWELLAGNPVPGKWS